MEMWRPRFEVIVTNSLNLRFSRDSRIYNIYVCPHTDKSGGHSDSRHLGAKIRKFVFSKALRIFAAKNFEQGHTRLSHSRAGRVDSQWNVKVYSCSEYDSRQITPPGRSWFKNDLKMARS